MALKKLTLATLGDVDGGKIAAALEQHLKKVTDDCVDRPGSKDTRKVTLELLITPSLDPDTGECDDVNIEFEIGSRVPKHRSRPINCAVRKSSSGKQLVFNDLSPENPNQRTLDEQAPSFIPPAEEQPAE